MEPQAGLTALLLILAVYLGIPCAAQRSGQTANESASPRQQPPATKPAGPYLVVLGVAQDGGYPQAGCRRECCARARHVPVYAIPRMREFLARNGPWDQLIRLENIELRALRAAEPAALNERLIATPILVPHRDEYSERSRS